MQPASPQSAPTPPKRTLSLAAVVLAIAAVFVVGAVIAGYLARQSAQESEMAATIAALQKEVASISRDVKALRADSERSAVLYLADRGYFPIRTNGGTLLIAVAGSEPIDNGIRVDLRVGNPQSMTYRGFTLEFAWDKGKSKQMYANLLPPDTWTMISVSLIPADSRTTTSLTISSAEVDELVVR